MDSGRRGNVMEGWLGSIVELEDAKAVMVNKLRSV